MGATMIKNKYATIKDLVTGKNFDFFNNFEDQVFKTKTICINDVGHDWYDCLSDDEQSYVQQLPKYSHLEYDEVIKQYDQDSLPNIIKRQNAQGWKCNSEGNIIGIIEG
tara:strand:- start:254 stop:580 length:327 start_codon:yes stop_codon:yes gene_type:complete